MGKTFSLCLGRLENIFLKQNYYGPNPPPGERSQGGLYCINVGKIAPILTGEGPP